MQYRSIVILAAVISFVLGGTSQSSAAAIIIDHTCTGLDQVPVSWIQQAKDTFRIWYGHTSHGSQITTGMDNLQSHYGQPYMFNESGSDNALSYQETYGDLGHNGDLTWEEMTREQLDDPANDRNVVMWSWCGGCSESISSVRWAPGSSTGPHDHRPSSGSVRAG